MDDFTNARDRIINAYEQKHDELQHVFCAFRRARKSGFRLCQHERVIASVQRYHAAVFCLSLFNSELVESKAGLSEFDFKSAVEWAIHDSPLLKEHVDFLLQNCPLVTWEAGV